MGGVRKFLSLSGYMRAIGSGYLSEHRISPTLSHDSLSKKPAGSMSHLVGSSMIKNNLSQFMLYLDRYIRFITCRKFEKY